MAIRAFELHVVYRITINLLLRAKKLTRTPKADILSRSISLCYHMDILLLLIPSTLLLWRSECSARIYPMPWAMVLSWLFNAPDCLHVGVSFRDDGRLGGESIYLCLNSRATKRCDCNFKSVILILLSRIDNLSILCQCHMISLMISQHWYGQWLGEFMRFHHPYSA